MSFAEFLGIGIGLFVGYKIRKYLKTKFSKKLKPTKKKEPDHFIYDDKI